MDNLQETIWIYYLRKWIEYKIVLSKDVEKRQNKKQGKNSTIGVTPDFMNDF